MIRWFCSLCGIPREPDNRCPHCNTASQTNRMRRSYLVGPDGTVAPYQWRLDQMPTNAAIVVLALRANDTVSCDHG